MSVVKKSISEGSDTKVKTAVPLTLAERWKWRAERDPAALQHNAPSKRRPASSPVVRAKQMNEKETNLNLK